MLCVKEKGIHKQKATVEPYTSRILDGKKKMALEQKTDGMAQQAGAEEALCAREILLRAGHPASKE